MRTVFVLIFCLAACTIEKQQPVGPAGPSSDNFERAEIGNAWHDTGPGYSIAGGELVVEHAYNHPLWLSRPIPHDAVIELDVWSNDDAGDLKVEAWGDGRSFATSASYTATSYVFIFGGWHNQISAIARMNEHGQDRKTRGDVHVVRGKKYHWRIVRKGGHIDWYISDAAEAKRGSSPEPTPKGLPVLNDNQPFLSFDDPAPLDGPGHSYFAVNDWEAELHFDNLKITAR